MRQQLEFHESWLELIGVKTETLLDSSSYAFLVFLGFLSIILSCFLLEWPYENCILMDATSQELYNFFNFFLALLNIVLLLHVLLVSCNDSSRESNRRYRYHYLNALLITKLFEFIRLMLLFITLQTLPKDMSKCSKYNYDKNELMMMVAESFFATNVAISIIWIIHTMTNCCA